MKSSLSAQTSRKAEGGAAASDLYGKSVFINCPFDDGYKPLFLATVFVVYDCGFVPRCALEAYDSGQVRIDKIIRIVESCRFGIHDISRTELDAGNQLPRFNMPLELGIFLGAQRFGVGRHRRKCLLVLDREPYRYQKFMSDIAGQDIAAHAADPGRLIATVRDWLTTTSGGAPLPGGGRIAERFVAFSRELPKLTAAAHVTVDELTFSNYVYFVAEWLRQNAIGAGQG